MDFLNRCVLLVALALSSSCAQVGYLYEQGIGQFSLLARAEDNKKILEAQELNQDQKTKIKNIESLKTYFYQYWQKTESKIYSKTTMLNQEAVSYLVITSPYNEIKATETCFAVMGCFPYLGFFSEKSAYSFAEKKEKENLVTWVRPVYAYSTLGYFTDTILSSFFYYDEYELAELIFHELFHTIFFVKNQVDLNENLATYFSENMLQEYFESIGKADYYRSEQGRYSQRKILMNDLMDLITRLEARYKEASLDFTSKEGAQKILDEFMEDTFRPTIANRCNELNIAIEDCDMLKKPWNNAKFSAYLTYEKNARDFAILQKKLGLTLKDYYTWIVARYDEFRRQSKEENFENFLFNQG